MRYRRDGSTFFPAWSANARIPGRGVTAQLVGRRHLFAGAVVNEPPRMLGQSPELQKMTCALGFSVLIARRRKTSGLLWSAFPSSSIDFASPRAAAIFWFASAVACATFASACCAA